MKEIQGTEIPAELQLGRLLLIADLIYEESRKEKCRK